MNKALLERYEHDKQIAAELAPLAKEGKVAVLYGGNHFVKDNDIDNLLGRESVSVIRMHGNIMNHTSGFMGQYDAPDYVFYDTVNPNNQFSVAGKLEPNAHHSEGCKAAIAIFKENKSLMAGVLACVAPDEDFNDFAASRRQTPNMAGTSKDDLKGLY